MTEKNWWPACTSLRAMLQHLRFEGSVRKKRLFGVACCRRVDEWLTDPDTRRAVEVAERYADGEATQKELDTARKCAQAAVARAYAALETVGSPTSDDSWSQAYHTWHAADLGVAVARSDGSLKLPGLAETAARLCERAETQAQCDLLRDIFGDPFHPVRLLRAWLACNGATVVKIAQGIYDEGAFDRLPILADALEDAGCNRAAVLEHCRSAGEHVRGCWVVDLILGKE
jgi:hypothetical protein